MTTDINALAKHLNVLADEHPTTRSLQQLRDRLQPETLEMLRVLTEETLP